MKTFRNPEEEKWGEILKRPTEDFSRLEATVTKIFAQVQSGGDAALFEYTQMFDGAVLNDLAVSHQEFEQACEKLSPALKKAIKQAAQNIEKFHASQQETPQIVETMPGVECWRKSTPIEKVGLYIPGGTAPLFSSVLMLAIPAKIAGCREIVLCSPPNSDGKIHPAILYAAQSVGVKKLYKLGGIQAVAAMAFGTPTVPKVYKIFGPGNQYVTAAKQMVNRLGVAIDMPAGPSEVLVVADSSAQPEFVAADLLSQAEHGADSQVVFLTCTESLIQPVKQEIERQITKLPRREIAQKALDNSTMILMPDKEKALKLINFYAPEHLIVSVHDQDFFIQNVQNAGSVFLGNFTPESAGDYASGTNHTLPTDGFAKAYSGVSLDSFVKKITFQRISEKGLQNIASTIEIMAEAEELQAHKNAVSIRKKHAE